MRFGRAYLFVTSVSIFFLLTPSLGSAKEDKFKCDNIYLLSDNFQDLNLHRFNRYNIHSEGFLITARFCKIDTLNKTLVIDRVENIAKLPFPTNPINLKSSAKLNVSLSFWNTVLVLDSVEVGHSGVLRRDRETYLTIYGNTNGPLGQNMYMLITPRFRYN